METIIKTKTKNNKSITKPTINDNIVIPINKGTGVGGANTNYFGKKFEGKTNNESIILQ